MKPLHTFLTVLMFAVGINAMAQGTKSYDFVRHAFVNVEGGAQYTQGKAKFSKLLTPAVQLGLGYQFSPVLAARLQASGFKSKGGWSLDNSPVLPKDYSYYYAAPGIDLMFNLSNLFCGYNPERLFSVTAFVGGGANIAWGNDDAKDIASQLTAASYYRLDNLWDGSKVNPFGRGGIELGFRLSDAVQLNIEGNANVISDSYNSKKANTPDWYYSALLGLRINLGKTHTVHVEKPVVRKTQTTVRQPAKPAKTNANDNYVEKKDPVTPVAPATDNRKVEKVKATPLTQNIFFDLNRSDIRDQVEQEKIKAIADYLKQYPQARVSITGYADVETGTNKINDQLSAERASRVAKALTDEFGISASRITTASKGSREQVFPENDQNRVAVCVAAE